MTLTVAEVEDKLARLEKAVTHLITYGEVDAANAVKEVIAEGKLVVEKMKSAATGGGEQN